MAGQCSDINRRLRWRCRRGTRELDLILTAFVDAHYDGLSEAERRRFERLLESADPQLTDWLCHDAQPADKEIASIVKRILATHRA